MIYDLWFIFSIYDLFLNNKIQLYKRYNIKNTIFFF